MTNVGASDSLAVFLVELNENLKPFAYTQLVLPHKVASHRCENSALNLPFTFSPACWKCYAKLRTVFNMFACMLSNVSILLFCFIYVREKHSGIQLYLQLNDTEALIDWLIYSYYPKLFRHMSWSAHSWKYHPSLMCYAINTWASLGPGGWRCGVCDCVRVVGGGGWLQERLLVLWVAVETVHSLTRALITLLTYIGQLRRVRGFIHFDSLAAGVTRPQ